MAQKLTTDARLPMWVAMDIGLYGVENLGFLFRFRLEVM